MICVYILLNKNILFPDTHGKNDKIIEMVFL